MIILDPKGELFGLTSRKAMEVLRGGERHQDRPALAGVLRLGEPAPARDRRRQAGARDGGKPDFDLMVQTAGDVLEALVPSANDTAGLQILERRHARTSKPPSSTSSRANPSPKTS